MVQKLYLREKRDLTQSYDKIPYAYRKLQKKQRRWQHKNVTKISITQRLRTDLGIGRCVPLRYYREKWSIAQRLLSGYCHQTGVVKPVYGIPTFPLTTKAV